MIDEALWAAFGLGMSAVGFGLGVVKNAIRPKSVPASEPTCSGYECQTGERKVGKTVYREFSMMTNCNALRNPLCSDGRCAFHCRKMCKCEAANDPEFIGRSRTG